MSLKSRSGCVSEGCRHHLKVLVSIIALWVSGCHSTLDQPGQVKSTTQQCGDLLRSETMLSDHAQPIGIEYGYDRPFIPAVRLDDSESSLDLPIEYGLQGGHHVDLSLRFVGLFDPDLVDLRITLSMDTPLTERFSGIHDTREWYLLFAQDLEPIGCYFHRARIFLFDDTGVPVQALGVSELHGSSVNLDIELTTQDAIHRWRARGVLRDHTDPR